MVSSVKPLLVELRGRRFLNGKRRLLTVEVVLDFELDFLIEVTDLLTLGEFRFWPLLLTVFLGLDDFDLVGVISSSSVVLALVFFDIDFSVAGFLGVLLTLVFSLDFPLDLLFPGLSNGVMISLKFFFI